MANQLTKFSKILEEKRKTIDENKRDLTALLSQLEKLESKAIYFKDKASGKDEGVLYLGSPLEIRLPLGDKYELVFMSSDYIPLNAQSWEFVETLCARLEDTIKSVLRDYENEDADIQSVLSFLQDLEDCWDD